MSGLSDPFRVPGATPRVLVVEDEPMASAFLQRGLSEEGLAVDVAPDAASADGAVRTQTYDLIVLDVMLPGTDGFWLCDRWRARGLTMPILFLTARDDVEHRVRGLEIGGDDYLVKPFAFAELLARVRALLRRAQGAAPPTTLCVGHLVIDGSRRRVTYRGERISLNRREYQLLECLARKAGTVVTRRMLWEHIWEHGKVPSTNVLNGYVSQLRQKLGPDGRLIETVRGVGYVFHIEPAAVRDAG
jgi:DNA-binding response OmpR family regulator